MFCKNENSFIFALSIKGALAQLVEQWTENPCVPSSILGGTTESPDIFVWGFLFWPRFQFSVFATSYGYISDRPQRILILVGFLTQITMDALTYK